MIERDTFGYTVECDKCSNYLMSDSEFFQDAVKKAKDFGWKIRKDKDGEWVHICPVCASQEMSP